MTKVFILQQEYIRLLDRDDKLKALENAGVDNWDGYDWAMKALAEEDGKCDIS